MTMYGELPLDSVCSCYKWRLRRCSWTRTNIWSGRRQRRWRTIYSHRRLASCGTLVSSLVSYSDIHVFLGEHTFLSLGYVLKQEEKW